MERSYILNRYHVARSVATIKLTEIVRKRGHVYEEENQHVTPGAWSF